VNIRTKALLLSNASLILVLFGIALGMRQPLLERFSDLERQSMARQIARVANTFFLESEQLDGSARSEATWTEMHTYLGEETPNVSTNFYTDTYTYSVGGEWGYKFLGLLDRQGRLRHLDQVNEKTQRLIPVTNPLRQQILSSLGFNRFPSDNDQALAESRNIFVAPTSTHPLLLVVRPVLKSTSAGPRHGAVIMGKAIDQTFLDQLVKNSTLKVKLIPIKPSAPLSVPTKSDQLLQISPTIQIQNYGWLTGNIHLLNGEGQAIYTLQVKAPRLEYQQGEAMLNHLTAILFGVGLALGVVISWLLDRSLRHQELLQASQTSLRLINLELEKLVNLDGLTQIANRRYFDHYLQQEWSQAKRNQTPLTLILCDIDYFKLFNDTYGHLQGDACLFQVAQCLKGSVQRPRDLVARYGGEEFAIILPETSLAGGQEVAKRIQAQVEQLRIEHRTATTGAYLSVSLGVACMIPLPNSSADTLIDQSDQNLYLAKQRGRNQIVLTDK
jgi:diguanylate cyclase (GGDEF)-like protein